MAKLFDMTNPFWSFMGKVLDSIVLHFLWLLCCLPVVTFGASTTALCYTLMKEAADRGDHYYRMFFKAFRANLKRGSFLGLWFLGLEGGLIYSIYLCTVNMALTPSFGYVRIISIVLAIMIFLTFEYAFPIMARFDNTVLKTMQNGFMLAIRHLGWTVVITLIIGGFYLLLILFMQYIFPLITLGFGFVVFICSFIMNHILEPYAEMAAKHEGMVSTDPDKWEKEENEKAALAEAETTGVETTENNDTKSIEDTPKEGQNS